MGRWQPEAAQRLAAAALDLFVEQGYADTTVHQIAQRAGLTKSTFFRHFTDKREVLFGSGDALTHLLCEQIAAAPAGSTAFEAVAAVLEAVGAEVFTTDVHEQSRRRRVVIAVNSELQERDALKSAGLLAGMTAALKGRGLPDLTAQLTAGLAALALNVSYAQWSKAGNTEEFAEVARRTLRDLRTAAATLR